MAVSCGSSSNSDSLQIGELPEAEYCGAEAPELELATADPFADLRYQEPAADLVSPFEACEAAYDELMSSRVACDLVSGRRTLLVSQQGEDDPRWQTDSFDDLFSNIQTAIDDANHCDTIIVRPGTYQEYLRIADKDVQIFSDTWNEDATSEDGNERVDSYTAENIDLLHYYETGERNVVKSQQTYRKPLKRTVRTILQGGGFEEGPTLGETISIVDGDASDPNAGCGNRRPMVDFVAGTTRNTIFDGFIVTLMPQQDHTIPGHGHTLQNRGGSPIIRHNVIFNNGSTGVGVHANFIDTTPLTPSCDSDPSLEQETFSNGDYRNSNVQYRPVPLIYDNISYQNNGLGLGNNHYSCAVMINNEAFWNAVPGEEDALQSPGIGTRHGAKPYLEYNIVYENAWTGIAVHQGYLQPASECADNPQTCNHIDERTQAVVLNNIVFDNGFGETAIENQGGIGLDGVGLPDEPVLVKGNIVYASHVTGIGVRNEYAGEARGFVMDDTYAQIIGNTVFSNANQGIGCKGSENGTSHCSVVGNDTYWNTGAGIAFNESSSGNMLNNVTACNSQAGITTLKTENEITIVNNIAYFNVLAGIIDPGLEHDYNLLSGNNDQAVVCVDPQAEACMKKQYGVENGGSEPGSHDIFVDPLFNSPLQYDYTLQSTSPCIDAGTDISSYTSDWVMQGSAFDCGSHEM